MRGIHKRGLGVSAPMSTVKNRKRALTVGFFLRYEEECDVLCSLCVLDCCVVNFF